jgi:LysM repeat protein
MREKGLLERKPRKIEELLHILKKLNPSIVDINLVHPGQQLVIPLKIVPMGAEKSVLPPPPPKKVTVAQLKDIDLKTYTVKRGDNLTRIVKSAFPVPDKDLSEEYLQKFKELNPSVKNPNMIYPGQVLRLPIYSPQVVRKTITRPAPEKPPEKVKPPETGTQEARRLGTDLGDIFTEMGETWVRTGQHFIPLKSGGQMDLNAEAFPILSLKSGRRVIVDLHGGFPAQMPRLIESSWGNYKVVQLSEGDNLRSGLEKVIKSCNYPEVLRQGQKLKFRGAVPFEVSGDWIVRRPGPAGETETLVIRLRGNSGPVTPASIKRYLNKSGLELIEYPFPPPSEEQRLEDVEIRILPDLQALTRAVLEAAGLEFTPDRTISVYQSEKADFKLKIKADFQLKTDGRDAVIDVSGLSPEMISLLKDHGIRVLSLSRGDDALTNMSNLLVFLGMPFEGSPQKPAVPEGASATTLTINGIVFQSTAGSMLATPVVLPHEIAAYLVGEGYEILNLTFP